ncbi:sigma-70 family RNA polymerase sigma factor [Candidatus Pacearchaeota archaeon]|nr:MAG: sigma-70 family RNA polymerase sigma factor [Candidatus Pacearchaeota archaeon]
MEMREMLSAYESAREIRSTIAFANKGMVAEVAMKFPGPYLTFAERMSAGFRALMRAVDMFNSSKGYRFSTYAYIAIQHELGKEIASEKETREERLGHLKSAWKNELAARWENVERAVDVRLVMDALNSRSSRRYGLGNRERKILSLYFGLNGDSPHTLEEIGKLHGISKERVRQLLNRALRSVRVSLKAGAC